MYAFTSKDDNKQVIEIIINDNSDTAAVLDEISKVYPSIKENLFAVTEDEIIVEVVYGVSYGFSLKELRKELDRIAATTVTFITVDLNEPGQRIY